MKKPIQQLKSMQLITIGFIDVVGNNNDPKSVLNLLCYTNLNSYRKLLNFPVISLKPDLNILKSTI